MEHKKAMIAVIGAGDNASKETVESAHKLGVAIAKKGWILVNGGRNAGIMEASSKGAKELGGTVLGILPDERTKASDFLSIKVISGMGNARNNIIIKSADLIIALQGGLGTLNEISLALKENRKLIMLDPSPHLINYLQSISPKVNYISFTTVEEVIEHLNTQFNNL